MVQTSLFSYQGWLALISIAAGVGIAAKLWLKPSAPAAPADSAAPAARTASLHDDPVTASSATAGAVSLAQSSAEAQSPVALSSSLDSTEADEVSGAKVSALAGSFAVAPVALLDHPVVKQPDEKLKPLGDGRYELDTVGAVCPFPLIEAKDAIGKIEVGEELVIPFDCTQATDAIPRWAAKDGHEVTSFEQTGEAGWVISVKRGQ